MIPTWMLLESGRLNLYLGSFLFGGFGKLMCDPFERRLKFLLWGNTSVGWDKTTVKEGKKTEWEPEHGNSNLSSLVCGIGLVNS